MNINQATTTSLQHKTGFAFVLITSLFFLWGFAHNLYPILIPHSKKSFTLSTTQATLVDSAVFIAYFLMALPAGFIMKKYGYKTGIIAGLLFFATGAFLFIPARMPTRKYPVTIKIAGHLSGPDNYKIYQMENS